MDIDIRKYGGVQIIHLRGDLKLGAPVDTFRQAVIDLLDAGETQIVVNLAEVPTVDSSGVGTLMRCLTTAKQRGGSVKLVKPSRMALQVLKLVGVLNLFEVLDDDQAALASFS